MSAENTNQFEQGVISMARSCKSALELVKRNQWSNEDFNLWLEAVIANNPDYYLREILTKPHIWSFTKPN